MRIPITLAAAAAFALAAPASAFAEPPNDATYLGGCFAAFVNETSQTTTTTDTWTGSFGAAVAAYSPTLGHNVVDVEVVCDLFLNGEPLDSGWTFGGTGAAAFARTLSFSSTSGDVVTMCSHVYTTDAHGQSREFHGCTSVHETPLLPDPVYDAARLGCTTLNVPAACDLLEANRVTFRHGV